MKKYRHEGGLAIIPASSEAVLFGAEGENDNEEKDRCNNRRPLQQQRLVRPVPVRVPAASRPIPQRVAEEFYAATHEAQIPFGEVHEAVRESHEWHRKWNSKQNIVTSTTTPSGSHSNSASPDVIDFIADREAGARNPSPGDRCDDRKRLRTDVAGLELSFLIGDEHDEEDGSPSFHPQPQQTILVKPVALRIARPVAVRPADVALFAAARPPSSIDASEDLERPLSPLSLYSSSSTRHLPRQSNPEVATAPAVVIEDETGAMPGMAADALQQARDGILHAMAVSGGETALPEFEQNLRILQDNYICRSYQHSEQSQGTWLTLTKPTFFECLGENEAGDPMYTLSRMSFDMFSPGNLICSLQGNFNQVERVVGDRTSMLDLVPKTLREEVGDSATILRTYNVITAFTIEPHLAAYPDAPNKDVTRPIRGIMTTYGYMVADPEEASRHSVWITGGTVEPNGSPEDVAAWKQLFELHPPKYTMGAKARHLAVKMLMGAVVPEGVDPETGVMRYTFTRPLGGHGLAYIDTIYCDDSLRIVKGHRGTLFVFTRMRVSAEEPHLVPEDDSY